MNDVKIDFMTVSDLDLIAESLFTDFDDFWNYNVFKSELENENSKYIVAKIDNTIVGYAGIWIAIDIAHITNIVVKKICRKAGIGASLLNELCNICEKLQLKELTLEVNTNNLPAINLYRKFGFEQAGLRKRYYGGKDDALILTKKLG